MTTLLVTSPGGHLRQMWTLAPRFNVSRPYVWATSRSAQSESLLANEDFIELPETPSRSVSGSAKVLRIARRLFRERDIDTVVSTGALPAFPIFLEARRRGINCHYIESAARAKGPSLTGKMVSRIPGVRLYSQYSALATGRWRYSGSVLDGFESSGTDTTGATKIRRVVVTVGVEPFGFRRALERLIEILPSDAEVLWQTGHTDHAGLPIDASPWVLGADLEQAMEEADVVVSHSGVGSAITAMSAGKCPVLLPRLSEQGEHVDNHQIQIAEELERRRLAVNRQVADLGPDDLTRAAQMRVHAVTPPPFQLAP